ncbi:MAG: anthranilate synthase component I family protein [Actinomycetota bacterium]
MPNLDPAYGLEPVDVARRLGGMVNVALIGAGWQRSIFALGEPVTVADQDPFRGLDQPGEDLASAWFGSVGFPAGDLIESLQAPPERDPQIPSVLLARYPGVISAEGDGWRFDGETDLAEIVRDLLSRPAEPTPFVCGDFAATPGRGAHMKSVGRVLDRIAQGEFFQANLTMRAEAIFEGDPLALFCAGVEAAAPRRAAFVRRGDTAIVSMSPETFLLREGRSVATEPIKGTRPAGPSGAAELAASKKDRAENIMIVDLMRNDLGRVCEPGSIEVPMLCEPQQHPGVWHLVSRVEGRLREGVGDGDLMRAAFPPGSVTGAPKLRALETINELEPWGRAAYTGAIGYSFADRAEWSVAIRTFEIHRDRIWFGVGGGIVADSDPEAEYEECLTKASTLLAIAGARLIDG